MTTESLTTVQRHALERALVDDTDARRYFALAGALEEARGGSVSGVASERPSNAGHTGRDADSDGVLSAALLALAVIPHVVESTTPAAETPAVSISGPWQPDGDETSHAVRRGATLALRWFDVSPEHVAAHARIPRADLVSSAE